MSTSGRIWALGWVGRGRGTVAW